MVQSSRFWDRIAKGYAKKPVPDEGIYQEKLQITREYLQPEMEIVEFGCGTGTTALAHAPYVKHIQAIDISAKMIEIARRKTEEAGTQNVDFSQSDLLSLPLQDSSVDVVLGLNILHLLDDRDETINRAHRILKPGGVFITSTACIGETAAYLRFIAPIGKWIGLMPLVKVFTIAELEKSMAEAGFTIDRKLVPEKSKSNCFLVAVKA